MLQIYGETKSAVATVFDAFSTAEIHTIAAQLTQAVVMSRRIGELQGAIETLSDTVKRMDSDEPDTAA